MIEQRSDEWHKQRAGKFTASRFSDVLARNKRTGEPLKSYHDLIWQVVVERMTGIPHEGPTGYAMQWGTDVEPYAREAYEFDSGNIVEESGFVVHPTFNFAGCSPDGLIGSDGGIEMKCPKDSRVHAERFISGIPDEYIPQIQGCMWVTGRLWWDFVSYDPRMPESHRMLIIRVDRDEQFIDRLENEVVMADSLARQMLEKIMAK